jgi:enoyl-CoA hydratase/carnithine racemase
MVEANDALAIGLADFVAQAGPDAVDVAKFLKPMLERPRAVLCGIKEQTSAWRAGLPYAARRGIERKNLQATWASQEHWAAVDRFLARGNQ